MVRQLCERHKCHNKDFCLIQQVTGQTFASDRLHLNLSFFHFYKEVAGTFFWGECIIVTLIPPVAAAADCGPAYTAARNLRGTIRIGYKNYSDSAASAISLSSSSVGSDTESNGSS